METIVDRFALIVQLEQIKMPWLQEQTGISSGRWHKVKTLQNAMRTSDLEALNKVWPQYAHWLSTGNELPEVGQISPITRLRKNSNQTKQ